MGVVVPLTMVVDCVPTEPVKERQARTVWIGCVEPRWAMEIARSVRSERCILVFGCWSLTRGEFYGKV
jgi:hypothetical protein